MEFVRSLVAEAESVNERRVLVCAGGRERTYDAAERALEPFEDRDVSVLSEATLETPAEHLTLRQSGELLGTTRDAIVVDCHDALSPNAVGRAVGAVDGGGLLVLLTPPLATWPDRRDRFDERLVVPPYTIEDVSGQFKHRFAETLRVHRGIAIYDADAGTLERDGRTYPAPRRPEPAPEPPTESRFPDAAYAACLTADQQAAVEALESLLETETAVVVEANRGRGKSSAAGIAAGALALDGRDVLVTAPQYRSAEAVFVRARALLESLGAFAEEGDRAVHATSGGRVRYRAPTDAADADADALIVDEAAALPVRLLEEFTEGDRPVAFTTTVHGYEGAGRGFSVRFRGHLDDSERDVTQVTMREPIRHAAGDPVEVWAFRALLLDARPPVDPLVEGVTPADTTYERLPPDALVADENRLREAFGLLVYAHYRTEPDDLARLLDAPNLTARALTHDGHVVAVALLAREGGLSEGTRTEMYEGARVRGHMLPDVLTSQLRDIDAAAPEGVRVMRIATHHAVRSRGLGSALLDSVREEFDGEVDYLGVGYGATPELCRFWGHNGYRTVHLSTTRNDTSGEYSALMIHPLSDAGRDLHERSVDWFHRRIPGVFTDALTDMDPAVARAALAASDPAPVPDLSDREWRFVAAAAFGPGLYDAHPSAFRGLALRALTTGEVEGRTAELLAAKVLQAREWEAVADAVGYVSKRAAMRALGEAYQPLVETYGSEAAHEEAARYS
ncbi:tRNA(Met) cytidine acetyltransferase TmcA [Natronomonas sp. EA1]|uniref:tRNA(Met) cytidine acetyltransferase TmcA n=1 Tax=Natronomonas sp. EA1 TaxID=3421655 RepID=UPI003EBA7E7F